MLKLTHGPLVGATTDREVSIWLRADGEGEVEIRLATAADLLDEPEVKTARAWLNGRQDYTAVLSFSDLEPDTTYTYSVLLDGKPVSDEVFAGHASLRTFPASEEEADSFSFAFGSCFIPEEHPETIFNNLICKDRDFDPRLFLMIGDNVYVDKYVELRNLDSDVPTESLLELYRAAYRKSWGYPLFRQALARTPSFMIFDDHEFWNNWNNEPVHQHDREGSVAAKRAYWEYQDQHNPDAVDRHKPDEDPKNLNLWPL